MYKSLLSIIALCVTQAYAIQCPKPRETPEGAEVFPTCGAVGVFQKDGKFGFFDTKSGKVLAEAQFDEVKDRYVAPRLTPVRRGDKWAYVDQSGQAATPYQYDYAERFLFDRGLAIVSMDGRFGMINPALETVVPPEYTRMDGFLRPDTDTDYLTVACKDGKCGFINALGETVVDLRYDGAGGFGAPVAPVKQGEKWGYINTKGETVQDFVYDEAPAFTQHWAGGRDVPCVAAKRGGATVIIDPQGKVLPEGTICAPLPPPRI